MSEKECIFCKIVRKEISVEYLEETDNFIAILDKNPVSEGHTLVLPKKHHVNLFDLPNMHAEEMLKLIKKISFDILEKKKGDGFNLIMNNLPPAGQVVMHAHIHIIPRKEGDGLEMIS